MPKRIESVKDLDGADELNIPDLLRLDKPADPVAWLQRNYGNRYEFADAAGLVKELTSGFAKLCHEEFSKGVEV